MTEKLYLRDAYLRAATARVVRVAEDHVVLDRTVLYGESGGQMGDHGTLRSAAGVARVVDSQVEGDDVVHRLEGPIPAVGEEVEVEVEWSRRYGLMRNHTAAHVLCGVMHQRFGSYATGNQLYPDKGRADFEFKEWRPEMKDEIEAACNEVLARDLKVEHAWIPREEFERGGLLRTKQDLVDPTLKEVRLTDIVGFDRQADGGTHVRGLAEVGRMRFGKVDNKGKGIRRLEWRLEGGPQPS